MPFQNIDEVISALQDIVASCKQNSSRAGYFAALYARMTMAVKEGIARGVFEDGQRMEQLDICFAERYTQAFECYKTQQPCTQSWQYAFDCCHNDKNIVLQHLLLGINTHINLDLAIAAATIAPGEKIYELENDFNAINQLISGLTDDVQECLSQVWLPLRLIAKIVNGRQEAVLNFSIDKARAAAWANAVLLANMSEGQRKAHIKAMDNLVKELAQGIQNPGGWTGYLVKLIRKTEYSDIARTIALIEHTVI